MKRAILMLLSLILLASCAGDGPGDNRNITFQPLRFTATNSKTINIEELASYQAAAGIYSAALLTGNTDNDAVAPISIYSTLSMLAVGAEGDTLAQLLGALHISDKQQLTSLGQRIMNNLEDDSIQYVNSFWLNNGAKINQDYLDVLQQCYGAASENIDFSTSDSILQIHQWVSDNTNGWISPMLLDNPDRIMAIANACSVSSPWDGIVFKPNDITRQSFTTEGGATQSVDMLNARYRVLSWEGEGFTAISIPLQNSANMIFVLPDPGTRVDELLAPTNDKPAMTSLFNLDFGLEADYQEWNISIPRFDITGQYRLRDAMGKLGVNNAFDGEKADFTAMTACSPEEQPVWADDIFHGARLQLNEFGICESDPDNSLQPPGADFSIAKNQHFILDRPFIFGVEYLGLPLIAGVMRQAE